MIVLGRFNLEDIFEPASLCLPRIELVGDDGEVYRVKIWDSQRIKLFFKSSDCVFCSRKGSYFLLETHRPDQNPHLNLYSEDDVLMTKDHIKPRSKGGKNEMSNYQTLCYECNQEKRDKYGQEDS